MAAPPRPRSKRKRVADPTRKSRTKAIECPICLDPVKPSQIVELTSCGCKYCKTCIAEALTAGLMPNTFPARCCGRRLRLIALEKHITKPLARRYRSKEEEVQSQDPAYCANVSCGQFLTNETFDQTAKEALEPGGRAGFATCGICKMKTCLRRECKRLKVEHLGVLAICPEALQDEELKRLANSRGWKRCPRCLALTEKLTGCDRMRCRCKANWCYTCGKLINALRDNCRCHVKDQVDLETDNSMATDNEDGVTDLTTMAASAD